MSLAADAATLPPAAETSAEQLSFFTRPPSPLRALVSLLGSVGDGETPTGHIHTLAGQPLLSCQLIARQAARCSPHQIHYPLVQREGERLEKHSVFLNTPSVR